MARRHYEGALPKRHCQEILIVGGGYPSLRLKQHKFVFLLNLQSFSFVWVSYRLRVILYPIAHALRQISALHLEVIAWLSLLYLPLCNEDFIVMIVIVFLRKGQIRPNSGRSLADLRHLRTCRDLQPCGELKIDNRYTLPHRTDNAASHRNPDAAVKQGNRAREARAWSHIIMI